MKKRRQSEHDPHYRINKFDRYGNVKPEWKAAYGAKDKKKRVWVKKNRG